MIVKYPQITVRLIGQDGNAFSIIARVGKHLRQAGVEKYEIDLFTNEAMNGDYDHVLQTVMKWVNVE